MIGSGLRGGSSPKPIWRSHARTWRSRPLFWVAEGYFLAGALEKHDHEPQFCGDVPVSQLPRWAGARQPLGDALTLLITSARSPFFFSLHASDPRIPMGVPTQAMSGTPFSAAQRVAARLSAS